MSMQNQKPSHCPTCDASLDGRWENITKSQITLLNKLHRGIKRFNRNSIHLQDDLNLTKNEYNNFQKLRYNGLVAHADATGCWLMTRRGASFLKGEIDLPKGVLVFRNRIQKYATKRVDIKSVLKNDEPYYYQAGDFDYQPVDVIDFKLDKMKGMSFDINGQGTINFDEL